MSHKKSNSSNSNAKGRAGSESSAARVQSNQNIRGVHFLREGNLDEAIKVLRDLVMPPGCTWTRPDTPNLYKRNFATALLLAGHPSGCLELLAEMQNDPHPRVQQLRAAIKRWEKTLSFFQWLNWRTGRIEPANRPIAIDFIPGELEGELPRPENITTGSASSHLSTSV